MEKSTPHCQLDIVKGLVAAGKVRPTQSALAGAASLGIDVDSMIEVVNALKTTDFLKSMTTHADHRIWQDVYTPKTPYGENVYLKLTVQNDVLIVSFKEL